ncbi:hypothetical protein ABPG74_003337 [Tetrahymena malaccensis]
MTELIKKIDYTLQDQYFSKNYPQSFTSQSSISSSFKSESNLKQKLKKSEKEEAKQILQVQNLLENNDKSDSNNEQIQIDLESQNVKRKYIEIDDQENIEELIYKKVKSDEMKPQNNSEQIQQSSQKDSDNFKSNQENISTQQQENLDCKQQQNESLQKPIQKQGEEQIISGLTEEKEKEQEVNQIESAEGKEQVLNNINEQNLTINQEMINQLIVEPDQKQDIQEQEKLLQITDDADIIESQKDQVENKMDEEEEKNDDVESKNDELEIERDNNQINQDSVQSKNGENKDKIHVSSEICTIQDQKNDDSRDLEQQSQEIIQIISQDSDQQDIEDNFQQSKIENQNSEACQQDEKQENEEIQQTSPQSEVIEKEEQQQNDQIESECEKSQKDEKINSSSLNQVENDVDSSLEKKEEECNTSEAQKEEDNLKDGIIEDFQTNIQLEKQQKNEKDEESQTVVLKNDLQDDEQSSTLQAKQDTYLKENQINSLNNDYDSKKQENSEMQVENESTNIQDKTVQDQQMEIEQQNFSNKQMNNQNQNKQVYIDLSNEMSEVQCTDTNQKMDNENDQQQSEQQQQVKLLENNNICQKENELQVQEENQEPKDIIQLEDDGDDDDNNNKNENNNSSQIPKEISCLVSKNKQISNEGGEEEEEQEEEQIDSTEIDPQEIINLYSLEFFTRKQKYLYAIQEKRLEDQKNQQDTLAYQNSYLKQNHNASHKHGDQKSQTLRKQKEDIKCGIETKCANLRNDDIQKYIQPNQQNSNIHLINSQPSDSAKNSIQKSKLTQNNKSSVIKDQTNSLNNQNNKNQQYQQQQYQQNIQQDKLSQLNTQQKQEQKTKDSKLKTSNQKKVLPNQNKQSVEQQKQEQIKQQQFDHPDKQQIQNPKFLDQRARQLPQNISLINIQDSRKNIPKNNQQQQKQMEIIDLESIDDEQKQKGDKEPYITIDSDGKLPQKIHQEVEIRKMERANNNNQNSSSVEITINPQNKQRQGSEIKQEKNTQIKQQTIDLEDDSEILETSNRQQFIVHQQNLNKRQQQPIEQLYQAQNQLAQQQINSQQQQKFKKSQPQQVHILDDDDSNDKQSNQPKQLRFPYSQPNFIHEGSNMLYCLPNPGFQSTPPPGASSSSSYLHRQYFPQYLPPHQLASAPQQPFPMTQIYPAPYQVVQPNISSQPQFSQLDDPPFHGKDSNEDYYMLSQSLQYRSKEVGKRDNGLQKDRNNSSANKNNIINNNTCDISSSESLQPQMINSKIQNSSQQMLQQNQKKQQPIQQAPIQYSRQYMNQGQIQMQPQSGPHLHQQNQYGMGFDMANYMSQQGYPYPQFPQIHYPYGAQPIPTANGACLIYGNQFGENQVQTEKDTKLGGIEYSSLSGGLDQQNDAKEKKLSKAQEILFYTMQVGQTENFDKIMEVNEQKEKHKMPDKSKPTDVQCTKNLLRNLNQTMLRFLQRSKISKNMMTQYFQDYENIAEEIEKFKKWALSQKMENFQQCRNLWIYDKSTPNYNYLQLFREIQFEFFSNSSCPAIFYSKVRNQESKRTHLKYISSFLEGLVNPTSFTCFKKSNKLREQEKEIQLRKQVNSSNQISSPQAQKINMQYENGIVNGIQENSIQIKECFESQELVEEEDEELESSDEEKQKEITIEMQNQKPNTNKKSFQDNCDQQEKTIEFQQHP